MRAGKLNNLVTIQEKITKEDGQGGSTEIWVNKCEAWANLKQVKSQEENEAGKVQGKTIFTWETWHTDEIKNKMRLVDELSGEVYTIIAPPFDPSGKRERLLIECEIKADD